MSGSAILALPNYGNAPYLWAAKIAVLSERDVVLPDYEAVSPGHRQRNILKEEFPDHVDRIFLSEDLGHVLRPILHRPPSETGFGPYASQVVEAVEAKNPNLEQQLGDRLHRGIEGRSLSGADKVFGFKDHAFVLNCGAPVSVHGLPAYFLFVAEKMSAIYRLYEKDLIWAGDLARIWVNVEKSFNAIFVPEFNAFGRVDQRLASERDPPVIRVSPLAMPIGDAANVSHIDGKALLVVYSGSGVDMQSLTDLANKSGIKKGNIFTLNGASEDSPFPRRDLAVFASPSIVAVLARGGWGTVWQCLANRKPLIVPVTSPQYDPEIACNIELIMKEGIGIKLDIRAEREWFHRAEHDLEICQLKIDRLTNSLFVSGKNNDGFSEVADKLNEWHPSS